MAAGASSGAITVPPRASMELMNSARRAALPPPEPKNTNCRLAKTCGREGEITSFVPVATGAEETVAAAEAAEAGAVESSLAPSAALSLVVGASAPRWLPLRLSLRSKLVIGGDDDASFRVSDIVATSASFTGASSVVFELDFMEVLVL